MKYFTPELYLRGNSPDGETVAGIEEEWERAIRRYRQHLARIQRAFPKQWHAFRKQHVHLHDAEVLSIARPDNTLVFVLRQEAPSGAVVILSFTLDGEIEIDPTALPGRQGRQPVTWMYEEYNVDRRGRCTVEVLLSNGWIVTAPFRDFQFLAGQTILPQPNGQAYQPGLAQAQPA
jgi:hypothetical protein